MNPHQVTRDFESALCRYTGAKYAVVVTSCTSALLLALAWRAHKFGAQTVGCPRRTYISVPMTIVQAGHTLEFVDMWWQGAYNLAGTNIWDSARRFTSDQFVPGQVQCCSFHASKVLQLEQAGVLLHDDEEADGFYRRSRLDGRTEGLTPDQDVITHLGYHCYVSPSVSAMGIMKLSVLPKHNNDLPNSPYPDLSAMPVFLKHQIGAIKIA